LTKPIENALPVARSVVCTRHGHIKGYLVKLALVFATKFGREEEEGLIAERNVRQVLYPETFLLPNK